MRKLIIVLLALLSAPTIAGTFRDVKLIGDEEKCAPLVKGLKDGLQWEIQTLAVRHEAGKELKGRLRFTKSVQFSELQWLRKYGSSSIRLNTEKPYPYWMKMNTSVDLLGYFFDAAADVDVPFMREIPGHVGANFDLELSLLLYTSEGEICLAIAKFGQGIVVDSADVHMTPPLLRSLSVDKNRYSVRETVEVTFTLSSPLDRLETDHFEFINPDITPPSADRGFPEFESNLFRRIVRNADGSYSVHLRIPHWVKPGTYYLKYFNRQDAYGNFESEVGGHDSEEKRLSLAAPVVVAMTEVAIRIESSREWAESEGFINCPLKIRQPCIKIS